MDESNAERMLSELRALIAELAQDRSLGEPVTLAQRIEALDRLEVFLVDAPERADDERLRGDEVYDRAEEIFSRLEAVNVELYEAIRHEIQQGVGRDRLLELAHGATAKEGVSTRSNGESYDFLDALVSGVLQFDEPEPGIAGLDPEMVPYQPTPARHIFDLIDRANITERDVLVDVGSGLGHVPLLVAICTGASCIGIEREGSYVDCARRSARALNLANVTFIQQDARDADYSTGTVFYLYTPFTGTILRSVLDSLRREAASREIRVCTFGPCTPTVAREEWLEVVGALRADRPGIFRPRT